MIPLLERFALDAAVALLAVALVDTLRAGPPLDERRHRWVQRAFMWALAPVVEKWQGLSLTRFLAAWIAVATVDVAHDWIDAASHGKALLGWPFAALVLGGLLLAVVTALGAKHIDKLLDTAAALVAAKVGVSPPSRSDDAPHTG